MKKMFLLLGFLLFSIGCSSQMKLKVEDLVPQQQVTIAMANGQKVSGAVVRVDQESVVLKDENGKSWRAKKDRILSVKGPEPVLDLKGNLISEEEIARNKTNKNFWLFTISGGVLSLGTSFFVSSMISRASDDGNRNAITYGGTAAGTAIGTLLFSRAGAHRDREFAIQKITLERIGQQVKDEVAESKRKAEIQKEIERIKQERAAQQAEIEALRKKIEEKRKKKQ